MRTKPAASTVLGSTVLTFEKYIFGVRLWNANLHSLLCWCSQDVLAQLLVADVESGVQALGFVNSKLNFIH